MTETKRTTILGTPHPTETRVDTADQGLYRYRGPPMTTGVQFGSTLISRIEISKLSIKLSTATPEIILPAVFLRVTPRSVLRLVERRARSRFMLHEPHRVVSLVEFDFPRRVETTAASRVHVNVTNGPTMIELVHQSHQRPLDDFLVEAWRQFKWFWSPQLRGRLKEVNFVNRLLPVADATQRLRILHAGVATNRIRHDMVDCKSNALAGSPAV